MATAANTFTWDDHEVLLKAWLEIVGTDDRSDVAVVKIDAEDLPGRFIQQGELLGYIIDQPPSTVRMAVSQDNIGQLRVLGKERKTGESHT